MALSANRSDTRFERTTSYILGTAYEYHNTDARDDTWNNNRAAYNNTVDDNVNNDNVNIDNDSVNNGSHDTYFGNRNNTQHCPYHHTTTRNNESGGYSTGL